MPREPLSFSPEERGFERVDDDSEALYATDTSRNATGNVEREEFRVRETGDQFLAQKVQLDDDGRIVGKETLGRARDDRDRAVESIESRVSKTTAAGTSRAPVGEFLVSLGTGGTGLAQRAHLSRSKAARASDRGKRAPITTDASRYAGNEDELDYPGVDTPSRAPDVRPKDLKQQQRPKTTDPQNSAADRATVPESPSPQRNTEAPEPSTQRLANTDVSLAFEEAFEGVGAAGMSTFDMQTDIQAPKFNEQRRLREGAPPESALQEQQAAVGGDGGMADPFDMSDGGGALDAGLSELDDQGLDAGVAVAGFASANFDATDQDTPNAMGLGIQAQGPLAAAKATDDDPDLADGTVDTLSETVDYLETEYDGDPDDELDGYDEFSAAVRQEARSRGVR